MVSMLVMSFQKMRRLRCPTHSETTHIISSRIWPKIRLRQEANLAKHKDSSQSSQESAQEYDRFLVTPVTESLIFLDLWRTAWSVRFQKISLSLMRRSTHDRHIIRTLFEKSTFSSSRKLGIPGWTSSSRHTTLRSGLSFHTAFRWEKPRWFVINSVWRSQPLHRVQSKLNLSLKNKIPALQSA